MGQTLVFALFLVASASCAEFNETCQNANHVHPLSDFNISEYSGSWHLVQRYNSSLEAGGCHATVNISKSEDESGFNVVLMNNLTGVAQRPDPNNTEARFNIKFDKANQTTDDYDFLVTSTNYTSYAAIWLCKDLTNDTSSQIVWIFSRTPELHSSDEAEVNRSLTSNKLNHTLLFNDETFCPGGNGNAIFATNWWFSLLLPLVLACCLSRNS